LKIAFIVDGFPRTSESFAAREIDALVRLGFEVTVLAARRSDNGRCAVGRRVCYRPRLLSLQAILSVFYLMGRYPAGLVKLLVLVVRLMRSNRVEVRTVVGNLHSLGYFARCMHKHQITHIHAYFLSWPGCIGLALSVLTGVDFSISAHARDIFVEAGAIELKAARARFIRLCSRQGLLHLASVLPARYHHKLKLVYHGVPVACGGISPAQTKATGGDGRRIIAAVGRLVPKKGFTHLILAFSLLRRRRDNCRLVIVGCGPQRQRLETLVQHLNLGASVQFAGRCSLRQTLSIIRRATVLVVPSVIDAQADRDGLCNVVLEAFACGTAVVASDLPALQEAVVDRRTGLVFEGGNVQSLKRRVEEVLADEQLRLELCERAYRTVVARFDLAKNVCRLAQLYKQTVRVT